MSPAIPSPTPIKGIGAPPGQRLPLAQLQQNDFAFALYAQALLAWQRDGNKAKDPDAGVGTSYFQVTGALTAGLVRTFALSNVVLVQVYMEYPTSHGRRTLPRL